MSCTLISIPEFGTAHDSGAIRMGHSADLAGAWLATPATAPGGGAPGLLRSLCATPGPAFTHRRVAGETPDPAAWYGRVERRARARNRPPGTRHPESTDLWCPDLPGRFSGGHSADWCSRRCHRPAG